MTLTERAAYLKGLAEGLGLDPAKSETRVINELIELVGEMTEAIDEQDAAIDELLDEVDDLNEYVDAIDSDLCDVEEIVGIDDDLIDLDEDEGEDEGIYQITCPSCGKSCYFTESHITGDEAVVCPSCGAEIDDITIIDDTAEEDD